MHHSMPTWQSSTELLRDSVFFFKLSVRVLPQIHPVLTLNAHLAELYRTYNKVLSATMFQLHSLASKVFNNLEVFFLSC
jgi:hypothetical protein